MNQEVEKYHSQRRAFIIIPNAGLILGEKGIPFSHREILSSCGFNLEQISFILENYPRGYFLNNKLVLYQSDDVKEGDSWKLKKENFPLVEKYYPDLKKIFDITPETQIFLGVYRGKEGEIWPTINEVPTDFFSHSNSENNLRKFNETKRHIHSQSR